MNKFNIGDSVTLTATGANTLPWICHLAGQKGEITAVFPGVVNNSFYYEIDFPNETVSLSEDFVEAYAAARGWATYGGSYKIPPMAPIIYTPQSYVPPVSGNYATNSGITFPSGYYISSTMIGNSNNTSSSPKYKEGNKVILNADGYYNAKGAIGTISHVSIYRNKQGLFVYDVEFNFTGTTQSISEDELLPFEEIEVGDLVEYTDPNSVSIKFGTWLEVVENCGPNMFKCCYGSAMYFIYGSNLKVVSKSQKDTKSGHSCTWKNYKGLHYQEEYCDCGQTKNRRGLFE